MAHYYYSGELNYLIINTYIYDINYTFPIKMFF